MLLNYKFTDKEIDKLLKDNLVIIYDTREQENFHILEFFDKRKIKYERKKVDVGDYTAKILKDEELGLYRDIYLNIAIEKKNSVDELAQSFKERTRFENEFIKGLKNKTDMGLLIEDPVYQETIQKHDYRSEYTPKALWNSLYTFKHRYGFWVEGCSKKLSGSVIYANIYNYARIVLQS